MRIYKTKQRNYLIDFLKKFSDRQFSVEEITENLVSQNISKSAIYRNINDMVSEGIINRFTISGNRKFLYQYSGGGECEGHFHLKCTECDKFIHVDEDISEKINAIINKNEFKVNKQRTIIYGICKSCR